MTPLDDRPSPTSPDRWLWIKTVVQAALDRPARDRASFVANECADDDLRLEVASLLAASEAAEAGDDFLVPPTAGGELLRGFLEGAGASFPDASAERVGAALSDRYTLERELGRGGMAVVSLASGSTARSSSPRGSSIRTSCRSMIRARSTAHSIT